MEKALWNQKLYFASEIADDYVLEKKIRKASGRRELLCPDPKCSSKAVKYCNGDKKSAYFAHIHNDHCDYAFFDSENTENIRLIRKKVYDSFVKKGYDVHLEVKLLPQHYTHLMFEVDNGQMIAVEIGDQRLSANKIDFLSDQYKKTGILVRWIVIGNANTSIVEKRTFFLNRYLLNESTNKDLIIVSNDGNIVTQHRVDTNKYEHKGKLLEPYNYPKIFSNSGILDSLVIENNEFTLKGFDDAFNQFVFEKKRAFEKYLQSEKEYSNTHLGSDTIMVNGKELYIEADTRRRLDEIKKQSISKSRPFGNGRKPY